jgi:hypothetical protein
MIIGVSPTQVERPQTPQDVAVTVFDLATTTGGLPRNLALEIAPYWLFSHPALTYQAYVRPRPMAQLLYNASLSVATSPVSGTTTATDLAGGLRSHLFLDLATSEQQRAVAEAEQTLQHQDELRAAARAYVTFDCGGPTPGAACAGVAEQIRKLIGTDQIDAATILQVTEDRLGADASRLQAALTAREGIVVSLAVAAAGRTPAGETIRWDEPTKVAAWIDGGYQSPLLDALAVVRYTHEELGGALDLMDAGARVIWVAPRFSLSAEFLHRWVLARPADSTFAPSNRATATIELPLVASIWLSATAGQDAATGTRPSTLITLLGVSFQASRDRQITLK